jgi:hypothetical protein
LRVNSHNLCGIRSCLFIPVLNGGITPSQHPTNTKAPTGKRRRSPKLTTAQIESIKLGTKKEILKLQLRRNLVLALSVGQALGRGRMRAAAERLGVALISSSGITDDFL